MVKTRYVGSTREREGGYSATHKRDFNAHIEGGDWFHGASDIQMEPSITSGSGSFFGATVQDTLEAITNTYISGGQGFVTIGDGYDNCAQDLSLAFTGAFTDPRLANGGIILVKAGTYCIQNTVIVPTGITVIGEKAGSVIIAETSEQPMFSIQSATSQPQTGTPMSEAQDKNNLVGLVFYDNLNQSTSTLITTAMIRCNRGSDLNIDGCYFIGKAVNTTNITNRIVDYNTGSTTKSTILTMRNSYVDNVASVIEFSAQLGAKDFLTVENNRFYTYGTGVGASALDTCAISSSNCNITVSNNYHRGVYATWGAKYFIHVTTDFVSDTATSISILGNSGGVTGGTPVFIDNDPSTSSIFKLNSWGSSSVLEINRKIVTGNSRVVQNSDFGNILSFTGSRIVLDCRNITAFGSIEFELDYLPSDGEDLNICIINHETRTPSISRFIFNTSSSLKAKFFPNITISDYHVPDPRPGAVTEYKFVYTSAVGVFTLISKNVSVYSTTFTGSYDFTTLGATDNSTTQPQRSHSVIKSITTPGFSTFRNLINDFAIYTNPVFGRNNQCCFAMGPLGYLWSDDGSQWTELSGGSSAIVGAVGKMAAGDESFYTHLFTISTISTSARYIRASRPNTYSPTGSAAGSVTLTGTASSVLYQGPGSGRFIVGTSSGIDLISSPYTAVSSNVLGGVAITDLARAPNGKIMAVSSGGNVYLSDTGLTLTPSFSLVSSGNDFSHISYNRVLNLWVGIDSSNVVSYSDDDGVSWTSVFSISGSAGSVNRLQMVGNATVICLGDAGSGFGSVMFAIDPRDTVGWTSINGGDTTAVSAGTGGLGPEPGLIPGYWGITWVHGRLVATRKFNTSTNGFSQYEGCSLSTLSSKEVGIYSLLDFDK